MQAIREYCRKFGDAFGAGWNRFWFTPRDPSTVCLLRLLVGLAAFYLVVSYTADLVVWFGPEGLLPGEVVRQLAGVSRAGPLTRSPQRPAGPFSFLPIRKVCFGSRTASAC